MVFVKRRDRKAGRGRRPNEPKLPKYLNVGKLAPPQLKLVNAIVAMPQFARLRRELSTLVGKNLISPELRESALSGFVIAVVEVIPGNEMIIENTIRQLSAGKNLEQMAFCQFPTCILPTAEPTRR